MNRTARWNRETLPGVSAVTAAAGIALAGGILFTGTFLAQALKDKGGEMLVAQVFQQQGDGGRPPLTQGRVDILMQDTQEAQRGCSATVPHIGIGRHDLQKAQLGSPPASWATVLHLRPSMDTQVGARRPQRHSSPNPSRSA